MSLADDDFRTGGRTLAVVPVVRSAAALLVRNLVGFGAIAALLVGLPWLLDAALSDSPLLAGALGSWGRFMGLFRQVLLLLAFISILYGAFSDLSGAPRGAGAMLMRGLRVILPVTGMYLLLAAFLLIATLAMVLLERSGIGDGASYRVAIALFFVLLGIAFVRWFAVIPVVVVEGAAVGPFRRNAALVRGNAAALLPLYLLLLAVNLAVYLPGMLFPESMFWTTGPWLGVGIAAGMVNIAFGAAASAVIYAALVRAQEGQDAVAGVFD
jgi:hypothetical protein